MTKEHGHDIASHCHEPGHFNSSVKHVCEMCHAELIAALARAETAKGALCSMKEALKVIARKIEYASGAHGVNETNVLEAKSIALAALSSSSPCPHELAEKRLREAAEWAIAEMEKDENADPPSEYNAYVESCERDEEMTYAEWFSGELRRRAGEGE